MTEWIDVALLDELPPGDARVVENGDHCIAIINLDGELHAIDNICTHNACPMLGCGLPATQQLDGEQVICPHHGARFDIRTGAALTPPAYEPVARYPVRVEYGLIQVLPEKFGESSLNSAE
jgi:3-phenylpropionate/trans-cinnamate dioxygenase ferredoxin subunit